MGPMTRTPQVRSRALLGLVAVGLTLLLTACLNSGQQRMVDLVNRDRGANGRAALAVDDELVAKAQAWAEKMARDGRLSHSNLRDGVTSCWRSLSENVAVSSSVDGLHRAWMASSGHRANILAPSSTHIGVGVVRQGDRYWGVQVFRQAC